MRLPPRANKSPFAKSPPNRKTNIMVTQEQVKQALQTVKYPGYSRDIVSFGLVKEISMQGGAASVRIEVSSANPELSRQIKREVEQALGAAGVQQMFVDVRGPTSGAPANAGPNPWAGQQKVPGIDHIVAIASGKGGVGKSTSSANIACALKILGARVGLLDCDVYGPSIPLMMGIQEKPTISENEKMVPPVNFGIKVMSMGLLIDSDAAVIWRGPMIKKTIEQFLTTVEWGSLDYLIVDLPPGTGDAQLTLCQAVPLDGGVIVTTPQEASLGVVRKGISMFNKVNVPILGILENMSYYTTPSGERVDIFGHGGGRAEAARQDVPFLGEVPIFPEIRIGGDQGRPITVNDPSHPASRSFIQVAEFLRNRLG
jgi:ATP-binding protein involved in chromosome partitioning